MTDDSAQNNIPVKKKKSGLRDTFDSIVVAFVIAMIIRTFFVQAFKIPSGSMLETLQIGDHILVNKMAYVLGKPKVDDIVVFEFPLDPEKDFIKRVIGIPGDKIQIEDKQIYRNGKKITENFTEFKSKIVLPGSVSPRDNIAEFIVPKDMYFVMGDNRDQSFDGRFWGFVPKDAMIGKAFIIYWSLIPNSNFEIRFNRIMKFLK